MTTMQRTWTQVGSEYNATDAQKERLSKAFNRMEWQAPEGDGPMIPVLGINEAIRELRLPKVSHVSFNSHDLAPFGLYGVRAHYKNGRVDVYLIDEGTVLTVLASDLHPIN